MPVLFDFSSMVKMDNTKVVVWQLDAKIHRGMHKASEALERNTDILRAWETLLKGMAKPLLSPTRLQTRVNRGRAFDTYWRGHIHS